MVPDQIPRENASLPEGNTTEEIIEMARKLDELAVAAKDPWDVLQNLGQDYGEGLHNSFVRACVERALAYGLKEDHQYPGALVMGVSFSSPDRGWPPPINEVSDIEKTVWNSVTEYCKNDLIRAHMLDLLISARSVTGLDPAIETIKLYTSLGTRISLKPYYKVLCLRRAWSLARKFNRSEEVEIREQLYRTAEKLVYESSTVLETQLQPFETLTVGPRKGDFVNPTRTEVRKLLEDILSKAKGHPPQYLRRSLPCLRDWLKRVMNARQRDSLWLRIISS